MKKKNCLRIDDCKWKKETKFFIVALLWLFWSLFLPFGCDVFTGDLFKRPAAGPFSAT